MTPPDAMRWDEAAEVLRQFIAQEKNQLGGYWPRSYATRAIAAIQSHRVQAEADARRYRWLRDPPLDPKLPAWIAGRGNGHIESEWLAGIYADAIIDAALAAAANNDGEVK